MKRNPIPSHPKIVLFANNSVGFKIAKFLKRNHERVVCVVIHPKINDIYGSEIKKVFPAVPCYTADQLSHTSVIAQIANYKADLGICAWFGYILKPNIIRLFTSGVLNTHNSYLPFNRGKYPQSWAIAKNTPYGVTIHYIDEKIDTGDILVQKRIPISILDNGDTLYRKSMDAMITLFTSSWNNIKHNRYKPKKQSPLKATHHYAKESISLDEIDPKKTYTALELINQIRSRSFDNRTYAYFYHKRKKIFVKLILSEQSNPS